MITRRSFLKAVFILAISIFTLNISAANANDIVREQLRTDSYYVSFPLDLNNYELGEIAKVGNPVTMNPAGCAMSIYRWNSTFYEKTNYIDNWGWQPAAGSETFTKLEPGRSYVFIKKSDSCIVEFTGSYPTQPVNVSLKQGYSLVSWHSTTPVVIAGKANILKTTPDNCITEISETDPQITTAAGFKISGATRFLNYTNGIWTPLQGSEAFTSLVPGKGYIFITNKDCVFSSGEVVSEPIYKSLQVTSPNGGQSWQIGTTQQISWNMTGINKVKLMLLWSDAGGNYTYQDITTLDYGSSVDSVGNPYVKPADNKYTYTWFVPSNQALRSNYRIEIRRMDTTLFPSNNNGEDYDVTDADFSIVNNPLGVPAVEVTSPNGGEQWLFGKTVKITWKRNWMPDQANGLVSIAIKKGDGMSQPIAQNIPDAGGYELAILPSMFIHGYDYKIIVTSNGFGSNLSDESDNYFSITEPITPSIKVIYPNGGELWEAGKTYTIKWYATVYDKVRLNVSCEGYGSGAILNVSSGVSIGSGYYNFTVPANWPAQNQCRVQVSENLSMLINNVAGVNYDMSDGYFSIVGANSCVHAKPTVALTPTTQTGIVGESKAYTYGVTITNNDTPACASVVFDRYGAMPNGMISSDDYSGSPLPSIAPGKSLSYNMKVGVNFKDFGVDSVAVAGTNIIGTDIINTINSTVYYSTKATAELILILPNTKNIQVLSPNGGETIVAGQDVEISFINSLTRKTDVQITNCADAGSLCNGNNYGAAIMDGNADNTIQKAVTHISLNATPGRYKAVINAVDPSSSTYNVASDKSDSFFNVVSSDAGSIIVSSPVNNSTYAQGDSLKIKWTTSGAIGTNAPVKIWLIKGYDQPILIKDSNVLNEFNWTIPYTVFADPYNTYSIKVASSSNIYISGNSGYFKVTANTSKPSVQVTSPNGGEQLVFGNTFKITWSRNWMPSQANGLVTVAIKKGDANPVILAQNVSDANGYSFTPSTSAFIHGYDYKIVVTSNGFGSNLSDESDKYFSIDSSTATSAIKVVSPNGGEKWVRGNTYDIKWSSNIVDSVWSIEATVMSAKGFGTIIEGVTGKDGKYSWTIPKTFASGYTTSDIVLTKIKIYNSKDPNMYDESDSDLFIVSDSGSCFLPDNTLVKLPNDPKIYVIKNCQKVWIRSIEEFNQGGYKWSDVTELPSDTVNSIPDTNNIPEGSMIQVVGDPDVYIVKYVGAKKFKRLILSPSVFRSYGHLKWENIIKVDKATLDSFTTSTLVKSENGRIYKLVPNGDAGLRNHIKDMIAFLRLAFDMDSVYQINAIDENSYIQGQELE